MIKILFSLFLFLYGCGYEEQDRKQPITIKIVFSNGGEEIVNDTIINSDYPSLQKGDLRYNYQVKYSGVRSYKIIK